MGMAEVCVFIVEDDLLVADVLEHTLSEAGFCCVTAHSGEEGMLLFEERGDDCRALVTDVNLGGKATGWDVARAARVKFPNLPVIYVTGDSSHEWAANGVPDSLLISKPYAPAQIVSGVAELLNKRGIEGVA